MCWASCKSMCVCVCVHVLFIADLVAKPTEMGNKCMPKILSGQEICRIFGALLIYSLGCQNSAKDIADECVVCGANSSPET